MSVSKDRRFYERRLQEELAKAANEPCETLRTLHRQWASLYQERLETIARQREVFLDIDVR